MKLNETRLNRTTKVLTALATTTAMASVAYASADYGPAVWRPVCSGKWNTSGYGKKFFVIHDMEGYYLTGIAYIQRCDVSVSIHYAVNGKSDTSSDAAPGEVSQLVSDVYYAWHARCWNNHSMGTEHEGFLNNPAWFTPQMYDASAALTSAKASKYGFAKDRNHIIGHDQKRISGWPAYASANLGIDPYCNTHTDPGAYWDWTGYMNRINPPASSVIVDNSSAGFSVTGSWAAGSSSTDKYGADYRYHSTAAVSEPAQWTANLGTTKSYGVSAWWPQGSNRSTTAAYHVYHSAGTTVVNVNQQANGGKWNLLGNFNLNAGSNKVLLSCWTATGFIVVADAIKWQ
jgi:hypothetical protein